ncbi:MULTISPECIES: FadR/GntR family transcriptional regulator [Paraburkholderia]|jgi:GntR family transcriptional repressor for pyruvate dehydrogenase complex|uniref:Pyruvate dehydrogenase complex repressor n=1 Tax=Paraburkholderia phenazinium TaxID=60549 RepID=A0A1N6KE64_9BURK|nr:FadR/GntR family transcriptional regulator [Paraburkholderia phenazinium]SIO54723.1 transcriptional regulator, GntR family [Paraburkholderia phenazinium]
MQFHPIQSFTRKRLSDVVSDQIKRLISDGALMPGDRLPAERDLATQLGVSRPSLREALIRLEADGYIETSGRGGFTVVDVTAPIISKPLAELLLQNPRTSADILELRQGLESIATVYAAERATAADLKKIRNAFEELKTCSLSDDRTNLPELDAAFHLAIADATHNVALAHVIHGIHTLIREGMRQYHRLIDYDDAKERQLLTQHQAIFDAVMARDAQKARKAAERHLTFVRELYEEEAAKPS